MRNFGGRLDGQDKRRLTEACYSLGLRFLKFAYTIFEKCEADLIDASQKTLREKDPKLDESRAREIANIFMFTLLKFTTLGVVKHVSNSIGLEKLAPVFVEVLKANRTIPRRMLDLSIRLDHFTAIPVDETLALNDEVQSSPIALDVLRQLVFNRFYFFTADYNIKQKVCQKLGIKIQPILFDQDQKRNA